MENKKKKIKVIIGIIFIVLIGGIVFYLTSHLTKTTICKGNLDMITTEKVEVISSDEKVKETKTQVNPAFFWFFKVSFKEIYSISL